MSRSPSSSHEIGGLCGTKRNDLVVCALVTLHTNSADWQKNSESLADLVVQTGLANLLDIDAVGMLQDLHLLSCNCTQDSDSETGAGEGVSAHEVSGNAEKSAEYTDFVCDKKKKSGMSDMERRAARNEESLHTLEQFAKGLDQLELHVLEQTADIVMRLDGRAGALEADALDDIGVKGALQQKFEFALGLLFWQFTLVCELDLLFSLRFQLRSLFLKHINESVADDLALALRVLNAFQSGEEELRRVDNGDVDAEIFGKHLVDLCGLVRAQNTVVDHNGVETRTDSLVHELGSYTTVHTT